jgi:hypothetical protein
MSWYEKLEQGPKKEVRRGRRRGRYESRGTWMRYGVGEDGCVICRGIEDAQIRACIARSSSEMEEEVES